MIYSHLHLACGCKFYVHKSHQNVPRGHFGSRERQCRFTAQDLKLRPPRATSFYAARNGLADGIGLRRESETLEVDTVPSPDMAALNEESAHGGCRPRGLWDPHLGGELGSGGTTCCAGGLHPAVGLEVWLPSAAAPLVPLAHGRGTRGGFCRCPAG